MSSFQEPTVGELLERAIADIENELQTGPSLRRSLVRALSAAIAGAAAGAHRHIRWAADQIMPDSADADQLARWASIWGLARKPGGRAHGPVGFSGTPGVIVPTGVLVQWEELLYVTIEEGVLDPSGEIYLDVEAVESGSGGNLPGGTSIILQRAVPGVFTQAFVGGTGLTGGNDPESDESLRTRLLDRLQAPARGGVASDYETWAGEVGGVTRAWAIANHQGVGTVGLTFVRDEDTDNIPTAGQVAEVQAHVDSKRPIGAQLLVFAPGVQTVDFQLTITPDTPSLRKAVEKSLKDLLDRASVPGAEIPISHMHEAISTTDGEQDHILIAPAVNIQLAAGEIAKMGEVTWSA